MPKPKHLKIEELKESYILPETWKFHALYSMTNKQLQERWQAGWNDKVKRRQHLFQWWMHLSDEQKDLYRLLINLAD